MLRRMMMITACGRSSGRLTMKIVMMVAMAHGLITNDWRIIFFFFFFSGKQSIRVPCSFTWENSQKPENKAKNRFNNIIPCKWWYAVKYEKSGVTTVVASKDKIRSTCHAYTLKEQVYQFYSTNQVSCCKECAWVHFGSIIIVYFGFTEVGFFFLIWLSAKQLSVNNFSNKHCWMKAWSYGKKGKTKQVKKRNDQNDQIQ